MTHWLLELLHDFINSPLSTNTTQSIASCLRCYAGLCEGSTLLIYPWYPQILLFGVSAVTFLATPC